MKNDEPEPMLSEPELFRRAFGAKARDPGDVLEKELAAERQKAEAALDDIEVYGRFDNLLLVPPARYVSNLPPLSSVWRHFLPTVAFPDPMIPGWALALWALAVLFWTPWIILRVERRSPPGDGARAAAILAFGLLAWPLALIPAGLAFLFGLEVDPAMYIVFPFVFLPGAGAMILARRRTPRPSPSAGRAALLGGGALIYFTCAAGLTTLIAGPMAGALRGSDDQDFILFGMLVVGVVDVLAAVAAFALARSAFRAWRGRLTAAAP